MPDFRYVIGSVLAVILLVGFVILLVLDGDAGDLMAWTAYLKPGLPPEAGAN